MPIMPVPPFNPAAPHALETWPHSPIRAMKHLPGGPEALDKDSGEVWQYMGTFNRPPWGAVHDYRHRAHPDNAGNRKNYSIPSGLSWAEWTTSEVAILETLERSR